uniref:Ribonuclease A-domain domain-containing protein n=1 Tax=Erpetoichthys calabaricus TaxID=27687 RepID=A0A8C4RSS2_ERPCA
RENRTELHGDPYEKFLRQHVDNSVKNGNYEYCAKMMKKRKMTRPVCKPLNTFIHANKNDVVAVCLENSPIQNGTRISKNQFKVTTCKIRKELTDPHPVHFAGLVPGPVPAPEFMLD